MLLPDDYAPPQYFCEECKPEDHEELLAAVGRGEKPWEEVARQREAAEAEKFAKKKGGKKGRKSGARASDIPPRASQDLEATQTPPATVKGGTGNKRKLEEPSNGTPQVRLKFGVIASHLTFHQDTKKARQSPTDTPTEPKSGVRPTAQHRKSSAMATPSRQASRSELGQGSVVTSVNELNDTQRRNAAGSLIRLFIDQTNLAVKQGAYSVPHGHTAKETGTDLGLRIEHAIYHVLSAGFGEPSDAYKNQMRTILFNVKKNPDLRDRLLSGALSAHGLAAMDAKDMASDELQQRDAQIIKEAEKQYTVIQDQGPRIRRTHKGDEYVDEAKQVASESTTSHAPPVRRPSTMEQDASQTRSPDPLSPGIPQAAGDRAMFHTHSRTRPSIDASRKSSANFNIQDVWSSVQGSPDGDRQQFPQLPQHHAEHRPLGPGTQADAEIDELLKDEDVESPPYSPKDSATDNEVVWRGIVNGGAIGRFQGSARYAAGALVSDLRLTWQQLIPPELNIEGRIDPAKADEYLCGLQYSSSSDVVIISIAEPQDAIGQQNFEKLFNYFKNRNRYGVGIQSHNPAIKDIYVIPLEAGAQVPELLQLLEQHELKGPITERLLLVPFVVKNTELASATPRDQTQIAASPLTSVPPGSAPPSHQSPMMHNGPAPPAAIPYGQHPAPPQAQTSTEGSHLPTPPPGQFQSPAAIAAMQVLGPMANTPAVQQLINQVPNAGIMEMNVVKEIITENPMAGQDLNVLTQMLTQRNQSQLE